MQQTFQCSGVSLISCINTTFRYRYGRDSATPPVDSSEGNNTNYRNDVQLGDKDLIDIGEFFVFERPISILDNGHIIAEVKELNRKLKNGTLTKEEIVAIKKARRKSKNRKYSLNGRQVILYKNSNIYCQCTSYMLQFIPHLIRGIRFKYSLWANVYIKLFS